MDNHISEVHVKNIPVIRVFMVVSMGPVLVQRKANKWVAENQFELTRLLKYKTTFSIFNYV